MTGSNRPTLVKKTRETLQFFDFGFLTKNCPKLKNQRFWASENPGSHRATGFKFRITMVTYIGSRYFAFLRTMVMNPNNRPDTQRGEGFGWSFLITVQHGDYLFIYLSSKAHGLRVYGDLFIYLFIVFSHGTQRVSQEKNETSRLQICNMSITKHVIPVVLGGFGTALSITPHNVLGGCNALGLRTPFTNIMPSCHCPIHKDKRMKVIMLLH